MASRRVIVGDVRGGDRCAASDGGAPRARLMSSGHGRCSKPRAEQGRQSCRRKLYTAGGAGDETMNKVGVWEREKGNDVVSNQEK